MVPALLVAFGGALGSVGRYGVNIWTTKTFGPGFPWGTLTVNVVGGLVMGLIAAVLALKGGTNELRVFLMTGIMGGFTTFSAFSLDAFTLWERGEVGTASVYVAVSVVLSIGALAAGLALGRALG
jgi:CrcB protein